MSRIIRSCVFLLIFNFLFSDHLFAQERDTDFKASGKPIIQVFGNIDMSLGKDAEKRGYRYLAPTFQDKYIGTPNGDLGIVGHYKLLITHYYHGH